MTSKATRAFLRRVCLLTGILACISSFFLARPQLYRLASVDFTKEQISEIVLKMAKSTVLS